MANSTTEQQQKSKDRSILQNICFQDFSAICQEYKIIKRATDELLEIADDYNTPIKVKVDIYKWILEMNVGKPRQTEIPIKEENKITGYEFEVIRCKNDDY